jgi:hypothetical protein
LETIMETDFLVTRPTLGKSFLLTLVPLNERCGAAA